MSTVRYLFDLTRPHTHMIFVTMDLPTHEGATLDLVMPAWLPGAYKIFDNARNLRAFTAQDGDGKDMRWERIDWQTWRIHDEGRGARVSYGIFANKPEIHQGQLNAHHAFLNPGLLGLYVDGHKTDWDVRLDLTLPPGWQVATGLDSTGPSSFNSCDYEEFIDRPLQVGHFTSVAFEQDTVSYEIVYEGATRWDPACLVPALQRVVAAATDLWGRPPLTRYVFMFLETEADFLNGLEHGNSTIITGPVTEPARRDGLIAITTHEFFHLWNVKRLRPIGLGPFDYTREAHTTALWVVEGLTEYYTDLLLLRAGLQTPESYLGAVANHIQQLEAMPGRKNMSLEEASWTTWHFGDDRWNGALNYYVKGYLLGVALDLELRCRSNNQVTLDDVMRAMWDAFGAQDRPYQPQDFCELTERLLGESLETFWAHHLRGKEDYNWDRLLGHAGLALLERESVPALQVTPRAVDGCLRLDNVLAGGAAQEAGLMIGDLLVAIGSHRATPALLEQLKSHFSAGESVEVTYFRRDRLCRVEVTLGRLVTYAIRPHPEASANQFTLRAGWLETLGTREAASAHVVPTRVG